MNKKFKLMQDNEVLSVFECQNIEIAIQYFSVIKKLSKESLIKVFKVVEVSV